MATTISTINESLVDKKVVSALRYLLPMLNSFSYRIESSGRIKSDSIYVPIATDPTAQSKTAGTAVTGNGTIAGTQVTLSNHYAAGWTATEGSISGQLFASFWADKAAGSVYALGKQVVDAALALITAANFGDDADDKLTVAPADFGQTDLGNLYELATEKILNQQVSLGLNAAYAGAMMGDSNIGLILATAGNSFFQTGVLPNLFGMNTWTYAAFPSNSQNLGGAAIGKAALLVAAAPPDPLFAAGSDGSIEQRIITDPDSGLSVLYRMWADGGGTIYGESSILYGVAKGQDAVVRIVSA